MLALSVYEENFEQSLYIMWNPSTDQPDDRLIQNIDTFLSYVHTITNNELYVPKINKGKGIYVSCTLFNLFSSR